MDAFYIHETNAALASCKDAPSNNDNESPQCQQPTLLTPRAPPSSQTPTVPPLNAGAAAAATAAAAVPPMGASAAPAAAPSTAARAGLPPAGPGQAAALALLQQSVAGSQSPSLDMARLLHSAEVRTRVRSIVRHVCRLIVVVYMPMSQVFGWREYWSDVHERVACCIG